ncbi:MAG: tRNA (adenosine(37)-N6)-threonylcarbamoyltransferase complex dimerization subunit type 1 TsaB [Lewinellaceae bacterium]|nr:tRNA (adenosine(37)-N6)-threonylcarbamoyltransferase complex dimerization subunit type 1 TsaB [Lewinellaceae bacterium]
MALILNIESSGEICSVCISREAEVLSLKESVKPFQHTEQITLLIDACCKEAGIKLKDLDAVAISSGPGSYTSLRVGTATAKGICYVLNKPIIAVDTLESLAGAAIKQIKQEALYAPMIDARRMEVYSNIYDHHLQPLEETKALIVTEDTYSEFKEDVRNIYLLGSGAKKCAELLPPPRFELMEVDCSALHLVPIAHEKFGKKDFADLAYFSPFYLKSPNITKAKPKL